MEKLPGIEQKPRVVHCKHSKYDVYVGRPSKWGNPFRTGEDGTREEVIEKHAALVQSNAEVIAMIKRELKGKILACWCAPQPCHADILLRIANEP